MALYKRNEVWHYDFFLAGRRYRGSTKEKSATRARIIESAIIADVKNRGLAVDSQPQVYMAFPQLAWGNMNLLLRTAADPHAMVSAVRAQITALDSDQPVTNIQTVDELIDGTQARIMGKVVSVLRKI